MTSCKIRTFAALADDDGAQVGFGQSWEKIEREMEQLELAMEDLMIATAESETSALVDDQGDDAPETPATDAGADRRSRRRALSSRSTEIMSAKSAM